MSKQTVSASFSGQGLRGSGLDEQDEAILSLWASEGNPNISDNSPDDDENRREHIFEEIKKKGGTAN